MAKRKVGFNSLFISKEGQTIIKEKSKLEKENTKLTNIVNDVSRFFGEHPKDGKTFKEWNK